MVKPRENRVPIMMSDAEVEAIDDWRFSNRIATRSQAIRQLAKAGLSLNNSASDFKVAANASIGDANAYVTEINDFIRRIEAETDTKKYRALASDLMSALLTHNDNLHNALWEMYQAAFEMIDAVPEIAGPTLPSHHLDMARKGLEQWQRETFEETLSEPSDATFRSKVQKT